MFMAVRVVLDEIDGEVHRYPIGYYETPQELEEVLDEAEFESGLIHVELYEHKETKHFQVSQMRIQISGGN